MGSYRLVFRKSVAKDLRAIPGRDVRRILATIDTLSENPRGPGGEKLTGKDKCRLRQGDYRIIYEIHEDQEVVVVVKVSHRREAYRR